MKCELKRKMFVLLVSWCAEGVKVVVDAHEERADLDKLAGQTREVVQFGLAT